MVYSKMIGGVFMLQCQECGGTCSQSIYNYDDVIHKEDCPRKKELVAWAKYPTLQNLISQYSNCASNNYLPYESHAARCCPALRKLLKDIPRVNLPPARGCDSCSVCYEKHFEPHEEEVLNLMEDLEDLS